MDPQISKITKLYELGLSQAKIAKELGISRSYVGFLMKRNGVSTRSFSDACPNKHELSEVERDEIIGLYASGLSINAVSKKLGISKKVVYRILRGKTRSISEANRLVTQANKDILTQDQLNLIYGTLLGDACLVVDGHSIVYSVSHCNQQRGYIEHTSSVLPSGCMSRIIQRSGFSPGSIVYAFKYRNKGALSDISKIVWVNGKKRVTKRWIKQLTPQAMAYWFMDDGSSSYHRNSVVIRFSTYSFDREELELLVKFISTLGIQVGIGQSRNKRHGKGMYIRVSQVDSDKFMYLIEDTVNAVSCMKYKLKYRRHLS
jgi:transposase